MRIFHVYTEYTWNYVPAEDSISPLRKKSAQLKTLLI